MSRRDPPRLRSFDYIGPYRYFVTLITFPRRAVFVSPATVEPIRLQLVTIARREGFAVFAYCFMPDHLHVLYEGLTDSSDFRRMMMLFKQATAHRFRQLQGQSLWASGYYERVLRGDEATIDTALYILGNPLRKDLAAKVEDYPYSGSDVLTMADFANAYLSAPG